MSPSAAPVLEPQPRGIPLPRPSDRSQPFWDGCRQGRLVLPRCSSCGTYALRAFAACSNCHETTLGWEQMSGRGCLYSWTVVWRPQHPSFKVPYAPAVMAVDEGWWLMTSVIGCAPEALRDGLPLQVEFHPAGEDIWLPYARPVDARS